MKRIFSLLLLLCTVFLLCACPSGGPTEPPTNNCPTCGKDPCECPETNEPCSVCGQVVCVCPTGTPCPDCGKDPCECPPPPALVIYGDGKDIAGAGDSLAANAPCLTEKTYGAADAIAKPAARFFAQVTFDGKVYRASGTVPAPLKNVNGKSYGHDSKTTALILENGAEISDCTELVFKNLIIAGDLTVSAGENIVFENVQFNGKVTVGEDATGVVFNGCRFSSLDNAGTDTYLLNSYVAFTGVGVTSSGEGLYIRSCRFEGTGTAVTSSGAALDVRTSTFRVDRDGIGVEICGVYGTENSIVAQCEIRGAQRSVAVKTAHNTVVLRNSLISVQAVGNTNLYVCDNEMGGRLEAENNNYLLADGNAYPADGLDHRAVDTGNENKNGDTVTDVNARLEVGANTELLPHGNKDQFIGMERRATVKEYGVEKEKAVYPYVAALAKESDCVILAPGAYSTTLKLELDASHSNTVIYAYGVLVEGVRYENRSYNTGHISLKYTEGLTIKGLSTGYDQQTCGQLYVLKKQNGTLTAVTGAGMWNEFAYTGSAFFDNVGIGIQRAGTYYALGDYTISAVKKNADGTMTVSLPASVYDVIGRGDVLTCRLAQSNVVVRTQECKDILFMDMTQYGYSGGYAFQEHMNVGQVTYYRVLDTSRSGMVIDEATYDKYAAWQDEYGVDLEISIDELPDGTLRYRGSPAHISSIDATHSVKCAVGSRVISCLFENMCDDGTNQRSNHARLFKLQDNGDGTTTIIYKGNLSERSYQVSGRDSSFSSYCADFREGDRVFVYTSAGQLVCDATALSATRACGTTTSTHSGVKTQDIKLYAVTVDTSLVNEAPLANYNLSDDRHTEEQKVLVDNMSRATNGFLFENTLVQNVRSRGLLIKSSNGTVKNCTFRNIAKVAVAMIYEIFWGESGVSENLLVEKNLIDHTSYGHDAPAIDSDSRSYKYVPIAVMGLGGKSLDPDFLLYKNITIKDNKLINRCLDLSNYAIYLRAACDVTITGNDFGFSEEEDGMGKLCLPLYVSGAMNVELSNNTYSPYVEGQIADYVHGKRYKNIFGTDVEKDGVSQIPDNP